MQLALIQIFLIAAFNSINCIDNIVNLPILNKCCSNNQFVRKKICKNMTITSNKPLDFSVIPIYNYKAEKTDQKIYDIFNMVPGKFHKDESFHRGAVNTRALGKYNVYLTENAIVYIEIPNAYNRWDNKFNYSGFCIDFYMNRKGLLKPAFWVKPDNTQYENDNFLTAAMFVSSFFLFLVLLVYALLPELRNLSGLILIAYVASLLAALLLLAIIRVKTHTVIICYRLTLFIYYFFLACFSWMNVISFDIWCTFRSDYVNARRSKALKYIVYSIYAWGLPLALTIMMAWINATDLTHKPWIIKPNLQNGCFIQGGEKLYYLYMPMLILICANWTFYLMTAFNIWRLSRGTSVLDSAAAGTPAAHRNHRQRFFVYLKLSVVMGLNWIVEVMSFLMPHFHLWYITDLCNVLVGVFIFVIFVCKRKIWKKLTKPFHQHQRSRCQWYTDTSTRGDTTYDSCEESTQLQMCPRLYPEHILINN